MPGMFSPLWPFGRKIVLASARQKASESAFRLCTGANGKDHAPRKTPLFGGGAVGPPRRDAADVSQRHAEHHEGDENGGKDKRILDHRLCSMLHSRFRT